MVEETTKKGGIFEEFLAYASLLKLVAEKKLSSLR